jgi:hypothetical protein
LFSQSIATLPIPGFSIPHSTSLRAGVNGRAMHRLLLVQILQHNVRSGIDHRECLRSCLPPASTAGRLADAILNRDAAEEILGLGKNGLIAALYSQLRLDKEHISIIPCGFSLPSAVWRRSRSGHVSSTISAKSQKHAGYQLPTAHTAKARRVGSENGKCRNPVDHISK